MISLAGLSATYPGYMAQENQTAETQKNQASAQEAAFKLLGAHVLGRALTGAQPGMGNGPQPPAPGQPSMPSGPSSDQIPNPMSQAPPQGASPPVQPSQPAQGAAGAPPAQGGSGLPEISLQALTQRILQTSPRVKDHPEILLAALERAAPILDRQSKEDLAELRKEMTSQRLKQTGELAQARIDAAKAWHSQTSEDRRYGVDTRAGTAATAEEGRNMRSGDRLERTDRRLDQTDKREERLAAATAIRQDQGYQRLQQAQTALDQKAAIGAFKNNLAAWRAQADAQYKDEQTFIKTNSAFTDLKPAEKAAFLAEAAAKHAERIAKMREMTNQSTTPTGGTTPAPETPKVQGQVPQAPAAAEPPATASAPPAAMLKPNTITTFANGQKWTLGPDGQPKQVP
jgi:hypothetical protein